MRSKFISTFATTILLVMLLTLPLLTACGSPEPDTPITPPEQEQEQEESEFDIVRDAVADYLADPAGNINASDLHMKIAEGDAPYIVSIRSAGDYAAGHIPGAVNMKFGELTTLPKDEEIVVYCYTGQSASAATALLGMLDYDVMNLRNGMSSWSNDPDVYVRRFDPETTPGGYAVETTPNEPSGSYDFPVLENTSSSDASDILLAAAKNVSPGFIMAADLNMKIAEEEEMTIISIRKPEHYAIGHIPGAINISYGPAIVANLDKIDPDAPVYVYCYTGHTAGQAMALLRLLGYDAYSVGYGMCGWSEDPAVTMGVCYNPDDAQGYEVEK